MATLPAAKGSPMRDTVHLKPPDEEACAASRTEARDFVAHQQGR
jgi:hypothetical protein